MNEQLLAYVEKDFGANKEQLSGHILFMAETLCPYCVLRCLNYQNISLFTQTIEIVRSVLSIIQPQAHFPEKCQLCHNILAEISNLAFRERVFDFIVGSGFEFNQYLLNVTVPSFYQLNDALYKHKLFDAGIKPFFQSQEKYAKQNKHGQGSFKTMIDEVIPIKKAAKFILGPYLTQKLACPVHFLAYFRCEIFVMSNMHIMWTQQQLTSLPKALRRIRSQSKPDVGSNPDFGLDGEVSRILGENGWNKDFIAYMCRNDFKASEISFEMQIDRDPVYVTGRYLKLQRGIAQTGDRQEMYACSDEEDSDGALQLPYAMNSILEPLFRKHIDFGKFVFHAAGREDIDVRMLGNGRPFICELQMAKNACRKDWSIIAQYIDSELAGDGFLRLCDYKLTIYEKHDDKLMERLYAGGQEKIKHYRALCAASSPVEDLHLQDIVVQQKTPIRVLHRRALKTREKTIFRLDVVETYGKYFVCDISASAGCYIKEFVHGDFGRTQPNLRGILRCDCEIMQLDVMGVEMQWPPEDVDDWIEKVAEK